MREGQRTGDLARFLTEPGAVIVTTDLADELGVAAGDTFAVSFGGREHALTLVGLVEPDDDLARQSSRDLAKPLC